MFNKPKSLRRLGFSLIELVVTIAILAVAGVAIMTPFVVSAKGYGAARPAVRAQAAGLLQEQAELIAADLEAIAPDDWPATLRSLVLSSPVIAPTQTIDGTAFDITRRFSCVEADLDTVDRSARRDSFWQMSA